MGRSGPHHATCEREAGDKALAKTAGKTECETAPPAELPTLSFASHSDWSDWLEHNHAVSRGVWILFGKKGSGVSSVSHAEALDIALCYGWIDSQARSHGAKRFVQKFTPRGRRSIWSRINRDRALVLVGAGQMQAAGAAEIKRAQDDGRWAAAYEGQAKAEVPPDLQEALDANPRAAKFFATVSSQNRYAVLFRIHNAKRAETRARKIAEFVSMLTRHETSH